MSKFYRTAIIYYLKPQKTDGMQFEPDELFERNKVLQVFFVSFIPEEGMLGDSILARYEFTRAALDRCDYNPQNETCNICKTKCAEYKTKRAKFTKRNVPLELHASPKVHFII